MNLSSDEEADKVDLSAYFRGLTNLIFLFKVAFFGTSMH
jgi:hypothetical protein